MNTASQITRSRISNCRICDSKDFELVIRLEDMPFTDEFIAPEKAGSEFLGDIEIAVCKSCGSSQNLNDTDMGDYYRDYTYSVQSSGFARQFMRTLAMRLKENFFKSTANPIVLEIGSGTGEQLLEFKQIGFSVIGVEPSQPLADYANSIGVNTLCAFFDAETKLPEGYGKNKVDLVISSYTFDHIPRPVQVLENIFEFLSDEGLLVLEVHNLELIRQRNEFCLFEHEHYTYLNESTLGALLSNNGFEPITFRLLDEREKRANSLLVVARKNPNVKPEAVDVKEQVQQLSDLNVNIRKSIERIDKWLDAQKGKKVAAYGAGGRGVMTIAALPQPGKIAYIIDKNPKAANIVAPKSHLPVVPIEYLANDRPDMVLVFSFGYFDEIRKELSERFGFNSSQFYSILNLIQE